MIKRKVTLEDVRNSISARIKPPFFVRFVGRPAGNLLTPLFYNTGWTANGVTGLRACLSVLAAGLLLLGNYPATAAAGGLFYLTYILDFVDGNIARIAKSTSYWGKYSDGLADMIFLVLCPPAAGIAVWHAGGSPYFIVLGFAGAAACLTSQLARNRLSFFREWMTVQSGPVSDEAEAKLKGVRTVTGWVAAYYVNSSFLAPVLLFVPEYGAALYVIAMIPAQILPETAWLCCTLTEGRIMLNRSRRSIHEPTDEELQERRDADRPSNSI